jgi:hypothetical protein
MHKNMPHIRVAHIRGTNLSVTRNRDAVTLYHLNDGDEKLESQESDISPHPDEVLDQESQEPVATEKPVGKALRLICRIRRIRHGSSVQEFGLLFVFFDVCVAVLIRMF